MRKGIKILVVTFALVLAFAVAPVSSISVEAAERVALAEEPCRHDNLHSVTGSEQYDFIDYSIHLYRATVAYVCDCCEAVVDIVYVQKHEAHFDSNGEGLCECGTYF